jgi:uncharacterized protein with LGFP repeats
MKRTARRGHRRALAALGAVVLALASLVATAAPAQALSGSSFSPGTIIADAVFFNANAMSQAQIQSFLVSAEPSCAAGYTCLKNYVEPTISARAANYCSAYPAATNQSASQIIYNVAQACGINPQVLIVTLQKEEGLVTSAAPSAGAYQVAMGYGCPDSTGCSSLYYGFFNQVFDAAQQFRIYGAHPANFNFKVGVAAIHYNPNPVCGTLTVRITDQATADLYNYTPYTPDAAALANLTGSGDTCSSYGNRNFWVYFNNWFGPTSGNGSDAIAYLYSSLGSASGSLGAAVGSIQSIPTWGGGLSQAYANGVIYWNPVNGAYAVTGTTLAAYNAANTVYGSLGFPVDPVFNVTQTGVGSVIGTEQDFQLGAIYSSAASSTAYPLIGASATEYQSEGGPNSVLGWPTGLEAYDPADGTGVVQQFQGGALYWNPSAGAHTLSGQILTTYLGLGGQSGALGWPISDNYTGTANGGGNSQGFQNGSMYQSATGAAFAVSGPIRDKYWSVAGEGGYLGWPTSAQTCVNSSCTQSFQNGTIVWSAATGAQIVQTPFPAIDAVYQGLGGPAGPLGLSIGGYYTESFNGGGKAQGYQNGSIYWTSAGGAFAVTGAIRNEYWSLLGEGGPLGWPIGSATAVAGGTTQQFQNGYIYSSAAGAHEVTGAIGTAYLASGAQTSALGWPASELYVESVNGGGTAQGFQNGSMYQSSAGAFAVTGAIRSDYWSLLGEGGGLGWPTASATPVTGGSTQSFQGGTIFSAASGSHAVRGALLTAYTALGAQSSALGWPISEQYVESFNGGGTAQGFQNGSMYQSAAGAFPVSGVIRNQYWAVAGETGVLGWPTSAQTCTGGTCTQSFQNGTIIATGSTTRLASSSANIDAVWQGLGGATGSLGQLASPVYTETVNGGGQAQGFANGSIYWSAASGGWAVSGPIRNEYWAVAGETGALGWPTGAQSCVSGTCTQTFQNGNIVWSAAAGAHVASGSPEIDSVWQGLGGMNGTMGMIISPVYVESFNGGGKAQGFVGGSIYWSAASGGYAVTGAIRDKYWSVLGEQGTLGWPTSAEVCGQPTGGCIQTFQHGTISLSASGVATIP